MIRRFKWWIFCVWLGVKWMPRLNLGDEVVYQGRIWMLRQGVRSPVWTLTRKAVNGEWVAMEAHERDFRKRRTLRNYWGSFRSGYRFFRMNWYGIWVHFDDVHGAPISKRKASDYDKQRKPYYP